LAAISALRLSAAPDHISEPKKPEPTFSLGEPSSAEMVEFWLQGTDARALSDHAFAGKEKGG